jgi:excisionase family DNA binding protein
VWLLAELLTVDQLAQILELHPRTIRRYIREIQLKASKVGGKWRIRREDAELFIGGKLDELKAKAVKISEVVMWHMNESNPNRGKAKFQYFYDDVEKKGRYIIWGNPTFVGKVLSAVGESALN